MTDTPAGPILECRNLTKVFDIGGGWLAPRRALRAVDDASIAMRRGEILAIVGESGCGKTTLSRMLLGLMRPSGGDILVNNIPIGTLGRLDLSRRVQPVFQDPYSSLNPRHTIGEIIRIPLDIHRIGTTAERWKSVERMMEAVGLARRLIHSYPNQLSGGQRQRVAIARALVIQPEIMICDEPTSALDVSVQAQILNLLVDLRDQFNLTYVFISHDLSVVEFMADRIAVMYMGRIVESGLTREVMRAPRHPYTRALMRSILTPDPTLGLPDLQLGRGFPDPLNPPPGCHFHPRCPDAMEQCRQHRPMPIEDGKGRVECHLYDGVLAPAVLESA